jgi:tetratricopeptide (TPR) repeat protein
MYNQNYYAPVFDEGNARKEPLSRRKIIILISALAVFIATIALTLFSIEAATSAKYDQAVLLMDSDVLKAKEDFLKLGKYKDSPLRAQECQDRYDFDCADALLASGDYESARSIFLALGDYGKAPEKVIECDYAAAVALMNSGKLEEAKQAFMVLGSYSDYEEQAVKCENEMDYIKATDLFTKKDYTNALKAFKSLNSYKDSLQKAQECMDCLYGADYAAALKLLKKKDYAKALKAFNALGYYKDSADKAQECQNSIDYIAADKAYRAKKFYTAYLVFTRLGDFSNSVKRAAGCIQKKPSSGEVYRNPRYRNNTSSITFVAPKSKSSICLKIYKGKTLVSTVFMASSKTATVPFPAGVYTIKQATGTTWFGYIETFGTDVTFRTIMNKNAVVKSGWTYKLKL